MVYRIPEAKPALKGGGSVDSSEAKPALAYDPNSEILMFSEESWLTITLSWLKTAFLFLVSAMVIFVIMYATLAASLLFATPVDGKVEVVARDTFLGGVPSKNDIVLSSPTQIAGEGAVDRLKEAALGVDDAQTVKILSGPSDSVQTDGTSFTVTGQEPGSFNGVLMTSTGEQVQGDLQLTKQYVAECMSATCTPGTFIVVDDDKIFGEIVELKEP